MAKKPDFRKSTAAMFLTMKDESEEVRTGSDIENTNAVTEIPISEIDDFPDHPFHVVVDEAMNEMADSIKKHGVLTPAVVRKKEDGRYELISGHRRKKACEIVGIYYLPAVVREMDRDESIIFMVDSNLQREKLLPSEKAFSYKMKLEALKRQGSRTDLTSPQVAAKFRSDDEVAKTAGVSGDTVRRYIRLAVLNGHKLELVVLVAAFYGLRRGEVLGLKWDAIDFERNTITIKRTVTSVNIDGKITIIEQDSAKTKSSLRTLPLVSQFREYFLSVRDAQKENKRVCGNSYDYGCDGYIFVDALGRRMKPDYISCTFTSLLEKNGLKRIRFHDLRHSCASLLLANGVPMKQIQEWLGHSDFNTTANIYAHLDYSSKVTSAQAMEKGLPLPEAFNTNSWTGIVST